MKAGKGQLSPWWMDIFLLLFLLNFSLRSALSMTNIFRLNGIDGSFMQLQSPPALASPSWNFTFEFRTNYSTGLLLYADDVIEKSFIILRLTEPENNVSQLECLIQVPVPRDETGTSQHHGTIFIRRFTEDTEWSIVLLEKNANSLALTLFSAQGKISDRRTLPTSTLFSSGVRVFMGGMPGNISTHYSALVHPSIIFVPRFRGYLRNIFAGVEEMGEAKVRAAGGAEIISRPGVCENGSTLNEAEFTGQEHVEFTDLPDTLDRQQIVLLFRSREQNGVILYAEASSGWSFVLFLQANRLKVSYGDGMNTTFMDLKDGSGKSPGDFALYNVTIVMDRDLAQPKIYIDGRQNSQHSTLSRPEPIPLLGSLTTVSVGGITSNSLTRTKDHLGVGKFRGSILEARLVHDKVHFDLIRKITVDPKSTHRNPELRSTCQVARSGSDRAVSFCQPGLFLMSRADHLTTLTLSIRTKEPHGLVMFHQPISESLTAVDMVDGQLVLMVRRLGKSPQDPSRIAISSTRLDDDVWHNLSLQLDEVAGIGRAQLDDAATDFVISGPGPPSSVQSANSSFNSSPNTVYLGGAPLSLSTVHPELWSVALNTTFRGGLSRITVNGQPVMLNGQVGQKPWPCQSAGGRTKMCQSTSCQNGGRCREGWNRSVCDCEGTGFHGTSCQMEHPELHFDGNQTWKKFDLPQPTSGRQVSDLTFRFRTDLATAYLLRLWCAVQEGRNRTRDSVAFYLRSGKLKIFLSSSALPKNQIEWDIGDNLHDGKWHFVKLSRRGRLVNIHIDRYQVTETILALEGVSLYYCQVDIAKPPFGRRKKHVSPVSTPTLPEFHPDLQIPFLGVLQELVVDSVNIVLTVSRSKNSASQSLHPETSTYSFKIPGSFVALSSIEADQKLDIEFTFRTEEKNGLILYAGKANRDFIAVELAHGFLHFVFNMGNGAQVMSSSTRSPLNDNVWHSVHIYRPSPTDHVLVVDREKFMLADIKEQSKLNLAGFLYVGGVSPQMISGQPRALRAQSGFLGCISGLKVNGVGYDLVKEAKQIGGKVERGCDGPNGSCLESKCRNGGRCVQQWTGFACDCDMTSFTGSTCSQHGVSYRFGPLPGLILYHFNTADRLDSRADRVAFGIVTTEDDAVICRIASFTSDDVMEFQIVAGHLFVVYNMGSQAHLVSELHHRLNDGRYHVVRLERLGPNATVQIDSHKPVSKNPTGKQLDTFNGISTVEIGGKLNDRKDDIDRAFSGIISGFVLNGVRVLEMAADGDNNIVVEGYPEQVLDLAQEMQSENKSHEMWKAYPDWLDQMQLTDVTQSANEPKTSDELFRASAPKCREEDESCQLADSSKSDDLIFAQYTVIRTTTVPPKAPTTMPTLLSTFTSPRSVICDDDEDCERLDSFVLDRSEFVVAGDINEGSGDASLLSARSAISRVTRPPIIINVTFTTPHSIFTLSSFSKDTQPKQPSNPPIYPGGTGIKTPITQKGIPTTPATTLASSPMNVLTEHAALIAGIAVGLVILVALVVFLALRYKKAPPREVPPTEAQKTYQTFSKPEPSPAGTMHRNGVQAGGGSMGRSKKNVDKEYYV